MDQFIERESETCIFCDNFQETAFDILHRRLDPEAETSGSSADDEPEPASEVSRTERRQRKEEMWRRYHQLWQSDGYGALYDLKPRLESRREEEEEKLQNMNAKLSAVNQYQDVMARHGGAVGDTDQMIEVFSPSSLDDKFGGPVEPRCHLEWRIFPTDLEKTEQYHIHLGKMGMRQARRYDPDFSYPLKFSPDDTVKEVRDKLETKSERCAEEVEEQRTIFRQIDLRLTLLNQFLRNFEITGRVPKDITLSDVPEDSYGSDKIVRYACIILKLHPCLTDAGPTAPGKSDLSECIREKIDAGRIDVEPQTVTNGVLRLMKQFRDDPNCEAVDEEFWTLLRAHEDRLRSAARRRDLDIPSLLGEDGRSDSSSK